MPFTLFVPRKPPSSARPPITDDEMRALIREMHEARRQFTNAPSAAAADLLAEAEGRVRSEQRHRRRHGIPWMSIVTPDFAPLHPGDGRSERHTPRRRDRTMPSSLTTWRRLTEAQRHAVGAAAPMLAAALDRESR